MITIIQQILAGLVTTGVLGWLYIRMIKRDKPPQIGVPQAVLPIILGIISEIIGSRAVVFWMMSFGEGGAAKFNELPVVARQFLAPFLFAAFPEEFIKLIMVIITLCVFRKKVKNVYEYILIGAAVGIGFSISEDYSYASELAGFFVRLPMMPGHMAMDMLMGEFLGIAMYNKKNNAGPVAIFNIAAFVVPVIIHTLYDAGTTGNYMVFQGAAEQNTLMLTIGCVYALVVVVGFIVYSFRMIVRLKKNAEKFNNMVISEVE
ncbi:PrsW family glutamic-type intramembrane protease [Butyrivibrio sp. JL13D10]|uniref:PrsW family glutamic-type intramembrane protease n=1 Tax=Butyrivibrio sp. JL13D10 TaxID=3236815 RepID=UPI0038B64254